MQEQLTLVSYDERLNRNNKPYLVVKVADGRSVQVSDPVLFAPVKGAKIIQGEVRSDISRDGTTTFYNLEVPVQVLEAGVLPETQRQARASGGGGYSGGGGEDNVGPRIVRQNTLNRGFDAAIALLTTGKLKLAQGETEGLALVRTALAIAEQAEDWVNRPFPAAVASPLPVASPVVAVAPPAPVVAGTEASPVDEFAGLPF